MLSGNGLRVRTFKFRHLYDNYEVFWWCKQVGKLCHGCRCLRLRQHQFHLFLRENLQPKRLRSECGGGIDNSNVSFHGIVLGMGNEKCQMV